MATVQDGSSFSDPCARSAIVSFSKENADTTRNAPKDEAAIAAIAPVPCLTSSGTRSVNHNIASTTTKKNSIDWGHNNDITKQREMDLSGANIVTIQIEEELDGSCTNDGDTPMLSALSSPLQQQKKGPSTVAGAGAGAGTGAVDSNGSASISPLSQGMTTPRRERHERLQIFKSLHTRCYFKNHDGSSASFWAKVHFATRVSIAVCLFLVLMVITRQQIFDALWLGNAFVVISAMKDNFGESAIYTMTTACDLIITCVVLTSIPATALHFLSPNVVTYMFAPIVAIVSFVIMSCPWISSKNLMVVVMYIILYEYSSLNSASQNPLLFLSLMGVIVLGCCFGTMSKLLPLPSIDLAVREIRSLLLLVMDDTEFFFDSIGKTYNAVGINTSSARQALSQVELASDRLQHNIIRLVALKSVGEFECGVLSRIHLFCGYCPFAKKSNMDDVSSNNEKNTNSCYYFYQYGSLSRCVDFLQIEQKRINQMKAALTSRVLGEDITAYNPNLKRAKAILSKDLEGTRSQFYNSILKGMATCVLVDSGAMKHNYLEEMFLSDDDPPSYTEGQDNGNSQQNNCAFSSRQQMQRLQHRYWNEELAKCIREAKNRTISAFHESLVKAEKILYESHRISISNLTNSMAVQGQEESPTPPPFSYFVRRLQALFGVMSYAERLAIHLETTYPDQYTTEGSSKKCKHYFERPYTFGKRLLGSSKHFVCQPWPTLTIENYRVPIKVGLGMLVASLWIVVPQLAIRSEPFNFWPGVTVASVNQSTGSSSYLKSIYRLWATMTASACALLLVFFVDETLLSREFDVVKIVVSTVVTFLNTFMQDKDRAYAFMYSSISIVSILFGSIKNDYYIEGYVMKRITFIFTGLLIFLAFELTVFPKSSRRIMEEQILDFVQHLSSMFDKLRTAVIDLEYFAPASCQSSPPRRPSISRTESDKEHLSHDSASFYHINEEEAKEKSEYNMTQLNKERDELVNVSNVSKKHYPAAIDEPDFTGFVSVLASDASGALDITIHQQRRIIERSESLVYAIERLQMSYREYMSTQHIFRQLHMPHKMDCIISLACDQISYCVRQLQSVSKYKSRLFSSSSKEEVVITRTRCLQAAATFRSLEDVRLSMLSSWSKAYNEFVATKLMSIAPSLLDDEPSKNTSKVSVDISQQSSQTLKDNSVFSTTTINNKGFLVTTAHQELRLDPLNLLMITRCATVVSSALEICESLQIIGRQFEKMARLVPECTKTR